MYEKLCDIYVRLSETQSFVRPSMAQITVDPAT